METNEFDAVFLKSYHELSAHEREEMKDMFTSEEEFLQMKMVLNSIQESIQAKDKVVQPSAATKQKLDHLFHQTYQNKGVLWYNSLGTFFINPDKNWHQQNVLRIAAVLLIGLLTVPFWFTELSENRPNLAKLEKEMDSAASKTESPSKEKEEPKANTPHEFESLASKSENTDAEISAPKAVAFEWRADDELATDVSDKTPMVTFMEAVTPGFVNHPDGIFKDESLAKKDIPQFNVKNNQFLLDFITASY